MRFERVNRNEVSLEALTESRELRAGTELLNLQIALAGLCVLCKVIHFLYLIKTEKKLGTHEFDVVFYCNILSDK